MLLSLFRCLLRHINHASINIATSILGGRRWHGIWRIKWSPTRYWQSLQLICCVTRRSVWLLMNQGQMMWFNDWIIKWRRHRYHQWWQLIVTCSTSVATTNTLWMWHDECNIILWWCFVPAIFLLVAIEMWEPNFWRDNFSHVLVYVPGIKLITMFLSQSNNN